MSTITTPTALEAIGIKFEAGPVTAEQADQARLALTNATHAGYSVHGLAFDAAERLIRRANGESGVPYDADYDRHQVAAALSAIPATML